MLGVGSERSGGRAVRHIIRRGKSDDFKAGQPRSVRIIHRSHQARSYNTGGEVMNTER